MAASDADTGFDVSFAGAGGTFANIRNINLEDVSRGVADTTHSKTTNGWATKLPTDVKQPGRITCELIHDNTEDWKATLAAAKATGTITWPNNGTTPQTYAADAFLVNFGVSITAAPEDDTIITNCEIQLSGEPTLAAAT